MSCRCSVVSNPCGSFDPCLLPLLLLFLRPRLSRLFFYPDGMEEGALGGEVLIYFFIFVLYPTSMLTKSHGTLFVLPTAFASPPSPESVDKCAEDPARWSSPPPCHASHLFVGDGQSRPCHVTPGTYRPAIEAMCVFLFQTCCFFCDMLL